MAKVINANFAKQVNELYLACIQVKDRFKANKFEQCVNDLFF